MKRIWLIAGIVGALALSFLAQYVFEFSPNPEINALWRGVLSKLFTAVILVFVVLYFEKNALRFSRVSRKNMLWTLPVWAVAVVNLPIFALASGKAEILYFSRIPLYLTDCLLIGVVEELAFRVLVNGFLKDAFQGKTNGFLKYIVVSSAIFGGSHLLNLLYGAPFLATVAQVGYSFLIGAMLTATYEKTGNIWMAVGVHALFDAGGKAQILGMGEFYGVPFWISTVVVGIVCFLHVFSYILKRNETDSRERKDSDG